MRRAKQSNNRPIYDLSNKGTWAIANLINTVGKCSGGEVAIPSCGALSLDRH